MKRSKLKNIINKSKGFSNSIVGESPFDQFKKSFPKDINLNDNYRLEAAWEAYGKPRNFKEAIWEGLIQPIDENNYAFPSIGYNTETDEYEYLNPGKENDIISKDIRVWDNDVIPLVKELKQGGYVRKFNEEKNCWTYTKNIQQETPVGQDNNGILEESSGEVNSLKQGGQMNVIPEGSLHARKNNMKLAKMGEVTHKGIPVIDNEGQQIAEVEKEEWTITKDFTEDVEKWYKEYFSDDLTSAQKDELAIKCGKRICKELLHNTDDRANLIESMEENL